MIVEGIVLKPATSVPINAVISQLQRLNE